MILMLCCVAAFAQEKSISGLNPLSLSNAHFEKLTPKQKQHLEVYRQIELLKANGQFSSKKCFEPKYKPFVDFVTLLEPLAFQEAQAYEAKAAQFLTEGNREMQAKATKRMNMCRMMAQLCKDAREAYNNEKLHGKLSNYMGTYSNYEYAMTVEGIKLPKREWLTPSEAELMIVRYYRNILAQKAKQKQQTGAK